MRPVEIARKLTKEMDQHRVQSLSRAYAPNEYAIWLSPDDRKQFEGYEDELKRELSGYLLEHARREKISLATRPVDRVPDRRPAAPGRVRHPGAAGRGRRSSAEEQPSQGDHGRTMVYTVSDRLAEPLREPDDAPRHRAAARRRPHRAARLGGAVLGRSREADVVVDDPNVSRKHAEVRPSGGSWIVRDLGSTNGVKVNGRRIQGPQSLKRGDVIELGTARVTFELE